MIVVAGGGGDNVGRLFWFVDLLIILTLDVNPSKRMIM